MAILSAFLLSENSNQIPSANGPGISLQIMNPQTIFKPQFIPGAFSFTLTLGLVELNPDISHKLQINILNTLSSKVIIDTGEVTIPPNFERNQNIPKEAAGLIMNFDLRNVAFENEGKYEVIINLDNQLLDKKPFYVFKQESI